MKITEYGTITEYEPMKITEYTKINRKEEPVWGEVILEKHPEWSEDKCYEYTVDGKRGGLQEEYIKLLSHNPSRK